MTSELVVPVTPMMLIERANSAGASVEQMTQLFELKLRVEADEARKAFNVSMSSFKQKPPQINKNKHVKFDTSKGSTEYDHATLDHVVEMITPALSVVGIRHRWEIKQDQALISVTCILSHDLGHSESTTIAAISDQSGGKNSIQAVASTVTYLERYTLLAAVGLAAANTDNDVCGADKGPKPPQMPDEEVAMNLQYIESAATLADLKKLFTLAYEDAEKIGDKDAIRKFIAAKDARKAEL